MNVQSRQLSTRAWDTNADTSSILVVDDERAIVGLLQDLLESEGYRVQGAFDGGEAIDILHRSNPHLIISDLMMPRVSGQELLGFLERIPDRVVPKIIFMSATKKPAGNTEIPFIEKPFDIEDLLDLVGSTIGDSPRL